ncbi:MAG: hypothetical protein ABI528_01080 [bacterium]
METNKKNSQSENESDINIENDLMKAKLTAEFGMSSLNSSLDPQTENEWLNYIYEWEKQFAEEKRISVYDRIGKPDFKKYDELPPNKVVKELERLLALMQENAIIVHCICDYDVSTMYKFITEELFQKEIDDIRIKGMNTNFIYEEFHPNHEYEIRELTKDFFKFFLDADWNTKHAEFQLADTVLFKQKQYKREEFVKILLSFREEVKPVKLELLEIKKASFDIHKGKGRVEGEITFSVQEETGYPAHVSGLFRLGVEFDDYYWIITEFTFPELE